MLVQMTRRNAAADHGDPAFGKVPAHGLFAEMLQEHACALKAPLIVRVGIRCVDVPIFRIDDHVENCRADPHKGICGCRRVRQGIDFEDVLVRQRELHRRVPDAVQLVDPVRAVELDDETRRGLADSLEIRLWLG